jgi:hypothetical protein
MMSALACVGLVAYFEGNLQIPLPPNPETRTSLPDLDIRLRTLENRYNVKSLPIFIEPDWHSIAWRLASLDRINGNLNKIDTVSPLMMPEPANISFKRLQTAVFGVPYRQGSNPTPDVEGRTEEEIMSILVQRLCHVAGSRGWKMSRIPENQEQLCAAVVAVSLELDRIPMPPVGWTGMGRPGRPPMRGLVYPSAGKKACCGCCSCKCHPKKASDTLSTTSTSSSTVVESRLKRFFRFGWLRSVACWRKKKDFDDASSTSSV